MENQSEILPYQERYEYVRDELQRRKIPDWRNHLLVMVKESLRQKQDIESCLYMTTLSEFENYFKANQEVGKEHK